MSSTTLASLVNQAKSLPVGPGVYLWRDRTNTILYIGKAKSLRRRVLSYFRCKNPKVVKLVQSSSVITHQLCKSDEDAFFTEQSLISQWKPKYNVLAREEARFVSLQFNSSTFPRLALVAQPKTRKDAYTPKAATLLLYYLRKHHGLLLQSDPNPLPLNETKYDLFTTAFKDVLPQHLTVATQDDYLARVKEVQSFLSVSHAVKIKLLQELMRKEAAALRFEQAAQLRDICQALHTSSKIKLKAELKDPAPKSAAMHAIGVALQILPTPSTMDCFDVSHLSGSFVVASCVRFKDGVPDKRMYRKFKLSNQTNDDFLAIQETVYRRYDNDSIPDLIIIDGGPGQVAAAMRAFRKLKKKPKHIIGLEKKEETIVFADKRKPLQLDAYNRALRTLQHIRDEAHRFANAYRKKLQEISFKQQVALGLSSTPTPSDSKQAT